MTSVYLATDQRLRHTVAVKVIHSQLVSGLHRDQFVRRFRSEALAAAAVDNPHTVQVYDTGEAEGLLYIVMEYVHGTNLRDLLHKEKTLVVRDALRVLSGVLDGLAAAHKAGLVHRDVKPENVLLNARDRSQITDFGLAKSMEENDAESSTTGLLLGTASYVTPETAQTGEATPVQTCTRWTSWATRCSPEPFPFASVNPNDYNLPARQPGCSLPRGHRPGVSRDPVRVPRQSRPARSLGPSRQRAGSPRQVGRPRNSADYRAARLPPRGRERKFGIRRAAAAFTGPSVDQP
ncbi:MAG: serine/threonine protein kinase [Aeriscardovia sp.]|nr:serine/threonine protein kinase [Aeriscardovia sp.]